MIDRIDRRANHGRKSKYLHDIQGVNSRLDTLQAAVLRAKLPHLAGWNAARRAVVDLDHVKMENVLGNT